MKIGIVFDNRNRPETTGLYCRRALGRLAYVEHFMPEELEQIPAGLFDLFFLVDDGLDYPIPKSLRPSAAWAIDTHVDFQRTVCRFGEVDTLFAAQKNGAHSLSQATNRKVEWLPLACDPDIHRPVSGVAVCYDIAFVGHFLFGKRRELIESLLREYPNSRFCQALFTDMARIYSEARLGFNCSVADDLNMRLFEIPSHRIPLVTNAIEDNGLEELFEVGKQLIVYEDRDQLLGIVGELLDDSDRRASIAENGYRHVMENHTYLHRMKQMLSQIGSAKNSQQFPASPLLKGEKLPVKPAEYFEFSRPDVQSLVPLLSKRILDVGCGGGRLGQELKRGNDVCVTGIEPSQAAAAVAKARLDRVVKLSIDQIDASMFPVNSFDTIIFADVLEHLRDPAAAIKKCKTWLSPNGSVVISVPNSRHHSVVSGLIDGNWTYERAGLLDEDHVRCFTKRELEKLLFRCNLDIEEILSIPGSGYQQWEEAGRPGDVHVGGLHIGGLTKSQAEEFYTYQYVVRATSRPKPDFGLTSIVVVTWNQLAFTKECVDSLLIRTDEPIELIFIDNGSTDGTPEYLASIPNAKVVLNLKNRGFAPAVNQGLKISTGKQIVLLNNDCVVSTGWLSELLTVLYDDERNGLVGPVSNNVSGEQQIGVSYHDITSMDGFAWDRRRNRELKLTDRLVGFCLLFRRDVMDRIGVLDEQFEIGCYEDDDFCRRAVNAGYRAVIAQNAFVHHYGSATFSGARLDFQKIMHENEQRFVSKWQAEQYSKVESSQASTSQAEPTVEYKFRRLEDGNKLLVRNHVKLSLCMIVRDNEDTIEACLDSVYPWVDEIIIVDTGSVDRTPEICKKYGVKLFEFPWCDDFSAARNESIEFATGEWIFWMDSDDVISQEQGQRLRKLVYGPHARGIDGYVMQVHCLSFVEGEITIVDHVKIFRNLPCYRFEHRIHEQILPAIRRQGNSVAFAEIHVVHSGSMQTEEIRKRKLERDFRILQLDIERFPDHPFVLFNLGMTYEDSGTFQQAEECLLKSIRFANEEESHLRKAWALLISCQRQQGKMQSAIETAAQALELFPGDKEILFRRATMLQDEGRLAEAIDDYLQVLTEPAEKVFQSIDPGLAGYKANFNLALAYSELGRIEQAIAQFRIAINSSPSFVSAWEELGRLFARSGQWNEVRNIIESMPVTPELRVACSILTGLELDANGKTSEAHSLLERTWRETRSQECLDELCRLLTERGLHASALPLLEQLRDLRPDDSAVLHNLGITLHLCNRSHDGIRTLQGCLEIAPDRVVTSGSPGEGPFMVIQIVCANQIVTDAAFQSHNCGVTVACGSVLTTMILNKSLRQCSQITAKDVSEALNGVPLDKMHVPEFAVNALQQAIEEALI